MAKRMKFSVVGLPHYTIWHLYEPSVDDIRHMEEMEKERKAREAEEKAKKERQEKISSTFDTSGQDMKSAKDTLNDIKAEAKKAEDEIAEAKKAQAATEADSKKPKVAANDDDDVADKKTRAKGVKGEKIVDDQEEDVAKPAKKK